MSESSEAITVVNETPLASTEPLVHLVARNPVEMRDAQEGLKQWLTQKLASVDTDIADYQASLDQATKNKWNKRGLQKAVNQSLGLRMFYEKILAAVKAGYTIIPEFPIDLFAIRVERTYPVSERTTSSWKGGQPVPVEPCEILPEGEGEYVSNVPETTTGQYTKADGQTAYYRDSTNLQDVVFPLRAARAEVMSATAEAMARRVFDEIGICPATKKADPLIIGRILAPKKGYTQKSVGFLIAWHLNLNEL